jgi:hypothetical protein
MTNPKDKVLYNKAKQQANKIYKKPSAYKSGYIVKTYKQLYKEKYGNQDAYEGTKTRDGLTRWYMEKWRDVGSGEYPLYRPTVRINKQTPKTVFEISKRRLEEQDKLKQKIKGNSNLPKF